MIRDRAKVAHQLHKLAVVGSSPAPVPRRGVDLFQKNHNQKTESALCSTLVATQPTYNRGLTSSFLFNGNCRHTGLSHMAVRTAKRFSWRQESGQQCPPCKPDAKERDIAAHATSLYAVFHKKMARDELSPRNALGRNRGDGGRVKILPLFNRGLAKPDRPTFCGKTASLQPRAVIQTFACAILFTVAPEILHAPSFSPWRPKFCMRHPSHRGARKQRLCAKAPCPKGKPPITIFLHLRTVDKDVSPAYTNIGERALT